MAVATAAPNCGELRPVRRCLCHHRTHSAQTILHSADHGANPYSVRYTISNHTPGPVAKQASPSSPAGVAPAVTRRRRWHGWAPLLLGALLLLLGGCDERHKQAIIAANKALDAVLPLVDRDTKQLREGVPEGAKVLGKHLDSDPGAVPEGLRRTMVMTRAGVRNLVAAKSNFFIFVAPDGEVLRGESDPDLAVGESLFKAIPEAKTMLQAGDTAVEVFGVMHGLRGVQHGDDLQWVLGSPVRTNGKITGLFVSGWSLRHYANIMEGQVRIEMDKARKDPNKAAPLVYFFIVKGSRAYGAAVTDDLNTKVVRDMDIVKNMKDGKFQQDAELDGHVFTVIGRPLPPLGEDAAAALMVRKP